MERQPGRRNGERLRRHLARAHLADGGVDLGCRRAYAHAGSLHDVTSAGNLPGTPAFPCTVIRQCTARPGYDLPTGLGTPRGLAGF